MSDPKPELHILVVFACEDGRVERLALQAAVGAVQARALIRLRRLTPAGPPQNEEARRMEQDYIAPRPQDFEWAHGVICAVPVDALPEIREEIREKSDRMLLLDLSTPEDCRSAGKAFSETVRAERLANPDRSTW